MRASWLAFCKSRRRVSPEKKCPRSQGVASKRPATASGCGGAGPSAASPLLSDAQRHRPRRGSWHPTPRRSPRRPTPFFSNLLLPLARRILPAEEALPLRQDVQGRLLDRLPRADLDRVLSGGQIALPRRAQGIGEQVIELRIE